VILTSFANFIHSDGSGLEDEENLANVFDDRNLNGIEETTNFDLIMMAV
jgi:hypothetical protein